MLEDQPEVLSAGLHRGLDADTPLTAHASCLRGHGIGWVGRYLKLPPHGLTLDEAKALSDVGLCIVSIFERGYPTYRAYFSMESGKRDGRLAYEQAHQELLMPTGAVIYFCVDYDASFADIQGPVRQYFDGVHDSFEQAGGIFGAGVYGSGATCGHILTATPTTHSWLAMSMGWLHSRAYTGWNARQTQGVTLCEVAVDFDQAQGAHFGQWQAL